MRMERHSRNGRCTPRTVQETSMRRFDGIQTVAVDVEEGNGVVG